MHADPKSVKKTDCLTVFSACKILVKLTTGVNFNHILWVAFSYKSFSQLTIFCLQFFCARISSRAAHKNVVEIAPWCQFHQHFMRSFYAHRSKKCKKKTNEKDFFTYMKVFCIEFHFFTTYFLFFMFFKSWW
jgi:hypothetical protein